MAAFTIYRLALIIPQTRRLVAKLAHGVYALPEISIPLWERPAEQLTRLIEEHWHIKSIVLDLLIEDSMDSPCAVIEVRSSPWDHSSAGLDEVQLETLGDIALRHGERKVIQSILVGEDSGRGPFSRIGWVEEAQDWVRRVTQSNDRELTGETLQLNAGARFCLIRFAASSGSAYWLKATGAPNVREFHITTLLSRVCPQYLPRLIATREDWNAWLMEEHGTSLRNSTSLHDFRSAIQNMAGLQQLFIGRSEALFSANCGDHRTAALAVQIGGLFAYLTEAMDLQTSTKVRRLSSPRLRELEAALRKACFLQQELGIPDSLIHNDISPGSILYDGERYVFTDWCETNVGNPFITAEQVCVHAARRSAEPELWARTLREEYKAAWIDWLTERQIDRALQLAPLFSILSNLHEYSKWLESPIRYDTQRLSYSRSLARHLDRVVQTLGLQEALCH